MEVYPNSPTRVDSWLELSEGERQSRREGALETPLADGGLPRGRWAIPLPGEAAVEMEVAARTPTRLDS